MKRWLRAAGCVIAACAALYAGRVLAFFLLSRIFTALNMSDATCAAAPAWLRFLWNNTAETALCLGLMTALAPLLFLRRLFPHERTPLLGSHLFLGAMGVFMGIMLVRLLMSMDCLREAGTYRHGILSYVNDLLICIVSAVLIRECVCGALDGISARIASAVLEAAVFCALEGGISVLCAVNGLITGWIAAEIFCAQRTIFPEFFICAGFRIGARRIAGFPEGRVYPVSENLLTGGSGGLESSLLLTIVFALVAVMYLLILRKGKNNEQENAHARKPMRGAKKG